jgi:TolA-binding protein
MSKADKSPKIELDEVMLAMDVVDTLRHRQTVVERELKSEEYDQALVEKVRKIYAGQGLEVSDQIITQGVAALREDRFTYKPSRRGFQRMLARLYVNRNRWVKRTAVLLTALLAVYLLYDFVYVSSQERRQKRAANEINLKIAEQQDQLSLAKERLKRLKSLLIKAQHSVPKKAAIPFKRLADKAATQIGAAEAIINGLDKLVVEANLDKRNVTDRGDAVSSRLEKRAELVSALGSHLDNAEAAVAALELTRVLPDQLADLRDNAVRETREPGLPQQAEGIYRKAMAALTQGDIQAAQTGYQALRQLYDQIVQEYPLQSVSRPGTPSGLWRYPKNQSGVRNYYIIVEAVTPDGNRLTLPIASEEDGQTRNVKQWGLRVDEAVFRQISEDKQDDGIINRNRFGVKKRGYLNPQYLIPTTGGAITQW